MLNDSSLHRCSSEGTAALLEHGNRAVQEESEPSRAKAPERLHALVSAQPCLQPRQVQRRECATEAGASAPK